MSTTRDPFAPFQTRDELAKGKRKVLLSLAVAVVATVLGVLAVRAVGDPRLATAYLAAAALHFGAGLGPAIRWSRTPEPGPSA